MKGCEFHVRNLLSKTVNKNNFQNVERITFEIKIAEYLLDDLTSELVQNFGLLVIKWLRKQNAQVLEKEEGKRHES